MLSHQQGAHDGRCDEDGSNQARGRVSATGGIAVTARQALAEREAPAAGQGMARAALAQQVTRAVALARAFAAGAPHYDRTADFPFENFAALGDAGLLALTVARADGGLGGGLAEAQFVVGEIARGEPATALVLAMHYIQHATIARREGWPQHLARRLAQESVGGIALINALQAEPGIGSPSRGGLPATVARSAGAEWRISGHKIYASGIPILSWLVVLAVTDEAQPRIGWFLVPAAVQGVRVIATWNATGMRATASHDVVLEDVAIPRDHALELRPVATGSARSEGQAAWSSGLVAAVYDGIARAARDWLIGFLNRHAPAGLGAPLATVPRIQEAVGAIEMRLATNAALLRDHARNVDEGAPLAATAGAVKHVVIENGVAVTTAALELTGNHGLTRDNPLERHHRDALCGRAHAPQHDVLRVNLGRIVLARGLPDPG
jgi:alkylation response protein AidB-like acyl-CoA dehydrogenase